MPSTLVPCWHTKRGLNAPTKFKILASGPNKKTGAFYLGDFDQLVVVVVAVKEGLFSEDHARKHAPQRPHVERVVVFLEVHQELRSFEIARRHSHVVLAL